MNSKRKNNWTSFAMAAVAGSAMLMLSGGRLAIAAGKGLDIEIAYEIKALKITGATSPVYVQVDSGKLIFSDASGAVFSSPLDGGTATLMAKVANPAPVGEDKGMWYLY